LEHAYNSVPAREVQSRFPEDSSGTTTKEKPGDNGRSGRKRNEMAELADYERTGIVESIGYEEAPQRVAANGVAG
jgi:hypothetical protein